MKRFFLALAALSGITAAPTQARPVTDCPLRDAPYSTASPMIDILLSPAAKAVVNAHAPDLFAHLPPMMASTTAPSFAAILTLRELMGMGAMAGAGRSEEQITALLAAIDGDLRQLPVTAADRVARCARYDNDLPVFQLPAGHPRLLLFEKINGFKDTPSVNAAHAAFLDLAKANGWGIVVTDKGGAITPGVLRRFDAVIWNNISGDVLTLSQRAALKAYVEHGGGFVGVHGSAGDPVYWWDWYVDDLIGARFEGHPYPKQFQSARVVIDNPADPIARGLPHEWMMTEEWYSFRTNPRNSGSHILATLDESTYLPVFMGTKNLRMGDHPIAWSRCIGPDGAAREGGRMFYSAIGHRPEMYADPIYLHLLTNAITWAARHDGPTCGQP
jgi:type 1 glutamine amidotransferase